MKNNKPDSKAEITRRKFIGTATAVTAFTIVPQHVLGQTAPSNLVNVAVVGSGGHGAFVVTQMLKVGGIHVAALCDVIQYCKLDVLKDHARDLLQTNLSAIYQSFH